jgi:hypothetical protein
MDCRSIQEKLSFYIDDTLPPQERMAVDEHLRSCRECAADLEELKKTLRHVKSLEEVEPPAWMTQKIMARVRAEAKPKKALFQRLFYPLYIKLPVGAIATIAIVLTTLYVFRTIEPEIRLAKAPTEEAAPQVPEKEQQAPKRDMKPDKIAPASPPLTPPIHSLDKKRDEEGLSLKGDKGEFDEHKAVLSKPSEQVVPSKEMQELKGRIEAQKVPEPMKQAELSQEQRATAPASGKDVPTPSVSGLAKQDAKREAAPAAPRTKAMVEESKESILITVYVKDIKSAQKEIEKKIKELEGESIRIESSEEKVIVSAILKGSRLHKLLEKLKLVGEVKEKELDIKGQEGDIRIKIEVKNPQQP